MKKIDPKKIQFISDLIRDKRARDENGLFVAEGFKIVLDILSKGHDVEDIIVSNTFAAHRSNADLIKLIDDKKIPASFVFAKEFERMSSLQNPQGIMAVIKKKETAIADICAGKSGHIVMCDNIQNPGNMGTMIRTAVAFKTAAIITFGENVDVYNPKVVRASSGMVLDIPMIHANIEDLTSLKDKNYRFIVSTLRTDSSESIVEIKDRTSPAVLVFGNEGKGVSKEIENIADSFFYIPTDENVESLNVAAAVAITLFMFNSQNEV